MKRQHEGRDSEYTKRRRATYEQSERPRKRSSPDDAKSLPTRAHLYNERFPYFRKPAEIGHFSIDANRAFFNDDRQLKYYFPPKDPRRIDFDLRKGYDIFIKKNEDHKDRLDLLLKWILANRDKFELHSKSHNSSSGKDEKSEEDAKEEGNSRTKQSDGQSIEEKTQGTQENAQGTKEDEERVQKEEDEEKVQKEERNQKTYNLNTDFVTWRGHLTKILCTPYENRDGWLMAVSLYNGTYYMSEVETEEAKQQRESMTDKHKEMTYWGVKFEQYVTSVDGETSPDTEEAVNNIDGYCAVVRTRLNSHSLVFSGEVDCCESPKHRTQSGYIELKTSREMDTDRQYRNFKRFKLLKWWAQSFLPGVPRIICGFRDDDGRVVRLQNYDTLKIPDLCKADYNSWNPAVCFTFCDKFLSFVKSVVKRDDPRVVYLFEWNPTSAMVTFTVHEEPEHCFLREWYLDSTTEETSTSE
ncbi:decapping and exoribonuclease protein-like [Ptychodera flava]|uniref:decapping and exoribonuclease protein-like n=1 Tax=Ptychodera flava TaxID=63121 RepID=UPI00396A6A1B